MTENRQLAAIMFTDMVGYTALMQSDEQEALKKRLRHKEVYDRFVESYQGKTLQYFGDGTLSIFTSSINCVDCAIAIQKELLQDPRVDIRIGIDTGDVFFDHEGIYGNGVNVASRIETLSVPGGIFISNRVFEDIKNHKHILTVDMGYFEMKNVQLPVHVYAIANEGLAIPSREEIKGKTKHAINTLAVLPFANLSNDPDNEYFSDGITEEILNALSSVEGLRVTSRTSSFAFKGRNTDIREIASKLSVEKIVEGSVRKSGNRVRITAQLINAVDGFHIWSETYDRDLTDIFEVQDEISKIIANKLRLKLSPANKEELLIKQPTSNLEAYALFLKARFHLNKEIPTEIFKAIELFKQAIALEPDFALAYALLAGAYGMVASVGFLNRTEALQQITTYSTKALAIDDQLAQAYVARGLGLLIFEWKWQEGYNALMKAIDLNAGATEAYWVLGYYYLIMNDPQNAVHIFESAWQRDPLSMSLARSLSIAYFYQENYDDTIRLSNMQLDVMPENWFALSLKGFAIGRRDGWNHALEVFLKANEISNNTPLTLSYLAYCYGRLGRKEEALSIVSKLELYNEQHPELCKNEHLLLSWCGIGDLDHAFEYLEKAVDLKEEVIAFMINSPVYESMHQDPRFTAIKSKMNL